VPQRRGIRGQNPEGREARRPADRANIDLRACHQSENCEGARLDDSPVAAPPGRPGDRMMNRRAFIGGMAGGLLAAPFGAEAQQSGRVWRIGYLGDAPPTSATTRTSRDAFIRGLHDLGYVERRDYVIEYRWAEGHIDRLPGLAAELVRAQVDVIVTGGTPR